MGVTAPQRRRLPCLQAVTDTGLTHLRTRFISVSSTGCGCGFGLAFAFLAELSHVHPQELRLPKGRRKPGGRRSGSLSPRSSEQAGAWDTREASCLTEAHARLRLVPSSSRPPRARGVGRGRAGQPTGEGPPLPATAPPRSRPQPLPPRLPFLYLDVDSVRFCTGTIDDFICLKCLIYMHIYLSVRIMF